MKHLNISIIFLFSGLMIYGQNILGDTFLTRVNSTRIAPTSKDFLQASNGAKNYISSIMGGTLYNDHVKINFKLTGKDSFQVYVGESGNAKILESPVYYSIHYYILNKMDTLSFFNLLVDSVGTPTPYDNDFYFSSPTKLLLGFKTLFSSRFKVDFAKAIKIGTQQGFQSKPFFDYQSSDKEGFYWRFSKRFADGKREILDINAETGVINKFYIPVLEQ